MGGSSLQTGASGPPTPAAVEESSQGVGPADPLVSDVDNPFDPSPDTTGPRSAAHSQVGGGEEGAG